MINDVIMRCSAEKVVTVEVDPMGIILHANKYDIQCSPETDILTEEWLQALSRAIAKIPMAIRKKITLVIPPDEEIFIRHIQIPDVTERSTKEAFRFECEQQFPDGAEEWCFDFYQTKGQVNNAFVVAIHRTFLDRIVDVLIRNKLQFSYVCPGVLLNTVAMQSHIDSSLNSMLIHIDKTCSYLICSGDNIEYLRTLPISATDFNRSISQSQKVSMTQAEELQLEFLSDKDSTNRTFMTYYAKQFSHKLRQELKKSELYYCRTFRQPPITTLYLSGGRCGLYSHFKETTEVEMVDVFDALKNNISQDLRADEVGLIKDELGVFVGAAHCLRNAQTKILNLFSVNFTNQIEFQRQNFGYWLTLVVIALLTLTGLKILKKDVIDCTTKRAALEAKLFETDIDVTRYTEVSQERTAYHSFIKDAKLALYSQATWIDLFNELQSKIEVLKTAWVESLVWEDRKNDTDFDRIKVMAKILMIDGDARQTANKDIENFITSLGGMESAQRIDNIKMSSSSDHILSFSFDIVLKKQSEILLR
jgi:Tfp pilus assembly PilM family ATPase